MDENKRGLLWMLQQALKGKSEEVKSLGESGEAIRDTLEGVRDRRDELFDSNWKRGERINYYNRRIKEIQKELENFE